MMKTQTNVLLEAVINSLKDRGTVKPNDILVHGQIKSYLNGRHITQKDLIIGLKDYIEEGYFTYTDNNNLHITQLGITQLEVNSNSR